MPVSHGAGLDIPFQVRRPSPDCSKLAETMDQDQIHQGIGKSIVDEMRISHHSPLRERAGGSCDGGSVCDIEDELRQTSEEAEGSPPSSAPRSQCNLMNQESQNNTETLRNLSEERLLEKKIEQQQCEQKEQEDDDEEDTETTSSQNKGPTSHNQQINESLQHQQAEEDEIIFMAPLSQGRQHNVKPYHKDNEDNGGDEDEDQEVGPPSRRKRRRIESGTTETATRMMAYTRSSAIAQAQTCSTQESTASQSSPADAESILSADYQEYLIHGSFKCVRIGRETTCNIEFTLKDLPDSFRPSIGLHISNSTSSGESVEVQLSPGFAHLMQRGHDKPCRSRASVAPQIYRGRRGLS